MKDNLNHKRKNFEVALGDVVLIKAVEQNRNKWPMGVVQQIYPGHDGVVRAVEVGTATGTLHTYIHTYILYWLVPKGLFRVKLQYLIKTLVHDNDK